MSNATIPPTVHEDDWVPVEHRIAGLDRRTLPPAIGVVILALVYTWLIPAINDAVPNDDETVAGDVMDLGGGVTFVPAIGWQVETGARAAAEVPIAFGAGTVELVTGATVFDVVTGPFEGDASELLAQINDNNEAIEGEEGFHVTSEAVTITTTQGLSGVQETYTGTAGTGIVTAFVLEDDAGTRIGVEMLALGPELELVDHADEVAAMIDSLRYDPPANEEEG